MRYFAVTAIVDVIIPKAQGKTGSKKVGGPKIITDGIISTRERCEEWRQEHIDKGHKVSVIRHWKPRRRHT